MPCVLLPIASVEVFEVENGDGDSRGTETCLRSVNVSLVYQGGFPSL